MIFLCLCDLEDFFGFIDQPESLQIIAETQHHGSPFVDENASVKCQGTLNCRLLTVVVWAKFMNLRQFSKRRLLTHKDGWETTSDNPW